MSDHDDVIELIWDKCRSIEESEAATEQAKAVAHAIRDIIEEAE